MKLHELTADAILETLEKRADAYLDAKDAAARAEAKHDVCKAAVYSALRKAGGISVDDAKARALENETVITCFHEWQDAEREKDRAYLALERARHAVELWRTEQSNRRRV